MSSSEMSTPKGKGLRGSIGGGQRDENAAACVLHAHIYDGWYKYSYLNLKIYSLESFLCSDGRVRQDGQSAQHL